MRLGVRRNTILAAVVASVVTFIIMAATRPEPGARIATAGGDVALHSPLDRIIPAFDVQDGSFRQGLELLSRKAGVPIHVRWRRLELAGDRSKDRVVTVHLINATLNTVLGEMLRRESQGSNPKLDYWVDGQAIDIAVEEEVIAATLVTRLYNIGELLHRVASESWPQQTSGPTFPVEYSDDGSTPASRASEHVIKLILDTVDSDTWKDNGGNVGSIQMWGSWLVVTQGARNQDAVAKLLKQLESPRESDLATPKTSSPADKHAIVSPPTR